MPVKMLRNFEELKMKNSEKFQKKNRFSKSFLPDIGSGCIGKNGYSSFDSANFALSKMNKKNKRQNGYLSVYKCQFCSSFHVGNQKKRIK